MVIVSLKSTFLLRSGFLPLSRSLNEEINGSQKICLPAATSDLTWDTVLLAATASLQRRAVLEQLNWG